MKGARLGRAPAGAFALLTAVVAACGGSSPSAAQATAAPTASPVSDARLTVFAAASLKDAIEQAVGVYHDANPGIDITLSTDSSAALEVQIEQGAPADLMLAADTANPDKLVAAGLAAGDPVPFAGNELIIVVPLDNPGGVERPSDLARPGLRIVAAGDEVPISRYARQVISNLASVPGYPPGFAAAYASNVVSKEDNVRAVLAKIELGEGDAAIVYATDAAASGKVEALEIPGSANVDATYAGVVISSSANVVAAQAFLDWLAGPDGYAILADLGFLPPS